MGYIRVSTTTQNIERQLDALQATGCEKIFIDKWSGKNKDRPELQKMMEQLRKEDIVVVLELSRFGRSVSDLITLVNEIRAIGAEFVSLKENWIDTSTPQGRYFFHTAAAFAELQRELIVQATAEGLQAARARGRVGGRPKKDQKAIDKAVKLYKARTHSIKEIAEITGVSKSTLYKALKG